MISGDQNVIRTELLAWHGRELQLQVDVAAKREAGAEGVELLTPLEEQDAPAAGDDGLGDVGARHGALAERLVEQVERQVTPVELRVALLEDQRLPLLAERR